MSKRLPMIERARAMVGLELAAELDDAGFMLVSKVEYWSLKAACEPDEKRKACFEFLASRAAVRRKPKITETLGKFFTENHHEV
jgi:hypothetical protein